MNYHQRFSFLVFIDSVIVLSAYYFGWFLLSSDAYIFSAALVIGSIALLLSHHIFAFRYKLYKRAWEYASVGELLILLKSASLSILTAAGIQDLLAHRVYFRLLLVTWMLYLLLVGGTRFFWRVYRNTYFSKQQEKKRTLIIGGGSAGTMVVRQLLKEPNTELCPVAFIDDDAKKQYLDIMGIPVAGSIQQIEAIVEDMKIDHIIIAIPSLSKRKLHRIFLECAKTQAKTQVLPMLEDLMTGKLSVNHFRDVRTEDLLGREPVELDGAGISDNIKNRVVLVTGAGGSIGSEICRQIAQFEPKQLVLLGHGENSIYSIEMELKELFEGKAIEFITEIADIQDADKMLRVMNKYKPQVVYHAAAHKHVPLMERNPEEAVKNNIMGTWNAAKAADRGGVKTFVMISTDKAVNPTSVMGTTKRLAEMVVQHMDRISKTKFVAVRFGNVLGSRGSVIPLFMKQIEKGGPVTVTHPDMVRYFMTIPEASRLVIQAGALAQGGEIFVLDMGDPVKIVDLAKNLITMSGYNVEDIGIQFTGIRPGEKLFEELLKDDEIHEKQVHSNIYIGKTADIYIEEIEKLVATYSMIGKDALRNTLLNLVHQQTEKQAANQLLDEDREVPASQREILAQKLISVSN